MSGRVLPLPLAAAMLFLSGAAGLLYEVVWFRRLYLVFGVSVFAIGAVVATFMLGLALGSRWSARSQWIRRNPVRAYGWLELGIAAYALAFPGLIWVAERAYVYGFRAFEGDFLFLSVVRFALSLLILLPPTVCMGATLPAIAEAVASGKRKFAGTVGVLYAINTVGGVFGTLLAGFWALEHLGITGSLRLGVVLNVIVAIVAFAYGRVAPVASSQEVGGADVAIRPKVSSALRVAMWTVFGTGLISMAGQIVWTRALVFFVHNSTYAFSAILAVYLIGIGAGAAIGARLVSRSSPQRWLVVSLGGIAVSSLVAILIYRTLPALAEAILGGGGLQEGVSGLIEEDVLIVHSWATALAGVFGQVAAVLLLPALFFGAVFPLSLALVQDEAQAPASVVGRLYAANTIGSVVGTVLGTFVLVATLGTRLTLVLLALAPIPLLALAVAELTRRKALSWMVFGGALVVGIAASMVVAPPGMYRNLFEERFGNVIWFSEGPSESVAICEHPDGSAWIHYSDGRGASGTTSYRGGWLYAHMPLLLHPDPESILIVCFGTGNTLGAASLHDLENIDGVELSTEVVKASFIFESTNHRVAKNPDVELIIEDGRNYLLGTDERYDVISEEPPLVHTAGVVNLYSKDFYELCRDRMTENGIMAVWLATWELMEDETKMLTRAFVEAFPHTSMWDSMHPGEWILIGSKAPLQIDVAELERRMSAPRIRADLSKIGIESPADLLSLYMKSDEFLERFTAGVEPVTDDKSVVDYTIPRNARSNFGLGEGLTGGLAIAGTGPAGTIAEVRVQEFDRVYAFRDPVRSLIVNFGEYEPDSLNAQIEQQQRTREVQASHRMSRYLAAQAQDLLVQERPSDALQVLEIGLTMVRPPATADLFAMAGLVHLRTGRLEEGRKMIERALAVDPNNRMATQILAASGQKLDWGGKDEER